MSFASPCRLAAVLSLTVLGCTSLALAVPFTTVDRGVHSGIRETLHAAVRTPAEWEAVWRRHAGGMATPHVDFAAEMVVAVFAGERRTSGYEIEITRVVASAGGLQVTYRERTPPAGALLLPVLTAPFHVIRLPRADGPVRVVKEPE